MHLYSEKRKQVLTRKRLCENGMETDLKSLVLNIGAQQRGTKDWQQPPEAKRGKGWIVPQGLWNHYVHFNTLMFWLLEMRRNVTEFVLICHENLIHIRFMQDVYSLECVHWAKHIPIFEYSIFLYSYIPISGLILTQKLKNQL